MQIEQRTEVRDDRDLDYQAESFTDEDLARGRHRSFVGGKWEEMGRFQLDYLKQQGLRPEHRFLDVGCGALRAGRHLVDYLEPGNYYGIDVNHDLLEAGYSQELTDSTRARLPVGNLRATDRFDADFGVRFDLAIAQSVFTHISLNLMRLCLCRVARVMAPGGRFYATFFEQGNDFPVDGIADRKHPHYTERNIFWYYRNDLRWVARRSPWEFRYIGRWGHPRGQRMVEYTRLPD